MSRREFANINPNTTSNENSDDNKSRNDRYNSTSNNNSGSSNPLPPITIPPTPSETTCSLSQGYIGIMLGILMTSGGVLFVLLGESHP